MVRDGVTLLVWPDGLVQVGTAAEHSFTVTGLSPSHVSWLRELLAQRAVPPTKALDTARRELLAQMRAAGLINSATDPVLADLRVRVVGLNRVTISMVRLLVEEGARYLDLRDRGRVDETVEYLFDASAKGQPRVEALREELSGKPVFLSRSGQPQVAITAESQLVDPTRAANFLYRDVPHLPVVNEDRAITVGPLFVPGYAACFLCLDRHHLDELPQWPGQRNHLLLSPAPPPSPALAAAAAGLAVTLLQSFLKYPGAAPGQEQAGAGSWFAGKQWRISETGVKESVWHTHPECGCAPERLFTGREVANRPGQAKLTPIRG